MEKFQNVIYLLYILTLTLKTRQIMCYRKIRKIKNIKIIMILNTSMNTGVRIIFPATFHCTSSLLETPYLHFHISKVNLGSCTQFLYMRVIFSPPRYNSFVKFISSSYYIRIVVFFSAYRLTGVHTIQYILYHMTRENF